MINPSHHARIVGILYLIVVVASVFALVTMSGLIVSGDAEQTARNILSSEPAFRMAFVANLLAAIAYTAVAAILYALFKPVNATLSAVAAFIGLACCASSAGFMLNQLAALSALDPAGPLSNLDVQYAQAAARQSLRLGGLGNAISLMFFGFYCLLLGWLVFGAHFLPRILGAPLIIAGAGWLVGNLAIFLAPEIGGPLSRYLLPASGVGELLFTLWLLAMGVDAAKWRAQSDATSAARSRPRAPQ